jgi:hypothetical protein
VSGLQPEIQSSSYLGRCPSTTNRKSVQINFYLKKGSGQGVPPWFWFQIPYTDLYITSPGRDALATPFFLKKRFIWTDLRFAVLGFYIPGLQPDAKKLKVESVISVVYFILANSFYQMKEPHKIYSSYCSIFSLKSSCHPLYHSDLPSTIEPIPQY